MNLIWFNNLIKLNSDYREILKTEATKKFIEKQIRELFIDKYSHSKVLKRNPGISGILIEL